MRKKESNETIGVSRDVESLSAKAEAGDADAQYQRGSIFLNSPQTPEYGNIYQAGHDGRDFLFVRQ